MLQSSPDNQAASIGQEFDVRAFTTVKQHIKLEVGWGHFFAGEFVKKNNWFNRQSFSEDQDWVYVMAGVSF